MASISSEDLPSRIAVLERRCQRLQWLLITVVVVAVVLPLLVVRFGGALSMTTTSEVVQADELRVKRILIDVDSGYGRHLVIEKSRSKMHKGGLSISYGPDSTGRTHETPEAFISPWKVGILKLLPDGQTAAWGFHEYKDQPRSSVDVSTDGGSLSGFVGNSVRQSESEREQLDQLRLSVQRLQLRVEAVEAKNMK